MNPQELRNLLLYAPRTDENYKKIPEDAGSVWFSNPTKSNLENARQGTYVRCTLIVLAFLYLLGFQRFNRDAIYLVFIIAAYEFAYTTLRKEKNTIDNHLADERYRSCVDEFLKSKYPEYKPSHD